MPPLKNLAGHDASIFLFRFDITESGISFVLNEAIAADMYEDIHEKLMPLSHACDETLLRYKELSVSPTIMDGYILTSGEFEVMLNPGLGKYFPEPEKKELFADAKRIADLLIEVMDRRTKEEKEGKQMSKPFRAPASSDPMKVKRGREELGKDKRLRDEFKWSVEGKRVRPGLKRMRPEDLPSGVSALQGYDQRGHCVTFEHETLGYLGRIVLERISDGKMLLQSELFRGEEGEDASIAQERQRLFEQAVATISGFFEDNFPA
jgi:hypothetical protein